MNSHDLMPNDSHAHDVSVDLALQLFPIDSLSGFCCSMQSIGGIHSWQVTPSLSVCFRSWGAIRLNISRMHRHPWQVQASVDGVRECRIDRQGSRSQHVARIKFVMWRVIPPYPCVADFSSTFHHDWQPNHIISFHWYDDADMWLQLIPCTVPFNATCASAAMSYVFWLAFPLFLRCSKADQPRGLLENDRGAWVLMPILPLGCLLVWVPADPQAGLHNLPFYRPRWFEHKRSRVFHIGQVPTPSHAVPCPTSRDLVAVIEISLNSCHVVIWPGSVLPFVLFFNWSKVDFC